MRLTELFRRRSTREPASLPEPVDLTVPEFFQDPYALYESLRDTRPLASLKSGGYLLTRHADISAALRDPRLGNMPSRFATLSPRNRDRYVAASVAANILPFLDRPDHMLPRHVVFHAVHSRFQSFLPLLPGIADTMLETQNGGRIDLISQIASPFALHVMSQFVGIDGMDRNGLKTFTQSFFHLFAPIRDAANLARVNDDLSAFRNLLARHVESRRIEPRDDLISRLLHTEHQGQRLSPAQAIDNAILVFADGVENVEAGIANVLLSLETFPPARGALENGSVSAQDVVHEALRLDSPAQIIPRIARDNIEIHGTTIPADTPVFLALASANRDAEVFDAPSQFRLGRDRTQQLTFGRGRHSCIGANLAVAQISVVIDALVRCHARVMTSRREITYHHRFGHRWPVELQVQLPTRPKRQ